jgi:hypothetical protein
MGRGGGPNILYIGASPVGIMIAVERLRIRLVL